METAIISIVCIALLVFGGMTMSQGFMTSVDASAAGLSEIGELTETAMRTMLTPVETNLSLLSGADFLEIVVANTGQTRMTDFEKWDVIVQYYDNAGGYVIKWLPFSASGGTINQWGVQQIMLGGQPEVFEPGVLNPGEQIIITTFLDPSVSSNATNMVVISTPSGVTCSTYFSP